MKLDSIHALYQEQNKQKELRNRYSKTLSVCTGTGCLAKGAGEVWKAFDELSSKIPASAGVHIIKSGCHGFCQMGPQIHIFPHDWVYNKVTPADVPEIIERSLINNEVIDRLIYTDPKSGNICPTRAMIPFYNRQMRIALDGCGDIDPESIEEYLAIGGFSALAKVLTSISSDQVIQIMERSGLRGRGGAGFSTGSKWRSCVEAKGDTRYIIGNGDEGDPGAFMDLSIMEGLPYKIIEGMMIGGYAVGSRQGYLYVRDEYPLAVIQLQKALHRCYETGLLGKNILGTGFDLDIRLSRGGGAFVCGESTALMRSLEGKVGEPRAKYIRSVVKGLYDKPTVLNNVETWACVPPIIINGPEWFSAIGTDKSKGTKAFSVVGKVTNTGIVEVPMGTTINTLIFDIGGGILNNRPFKGVQTGGPSGGCIPANLGHLPLDYEALTDAGSMMGSGGLIVMDDQTCMVDVAKYFIHFLLEESCGKCVPCREGLRQLYRLLERITKGEPQDLGQIRELCYAIEKASLCGLGTSAVNPVLSTLRYFEEEYNDHIQRKKCPAGVCRELIHLHIQESCIGCGRCSKLCPVGAITGEKQKIHIIDESKCTKCKACVDVCPVNAVTVE